MAEYVLGEDEDQEKVVQELLANATHPDQVMWQPRSGVPKGGVYVVDDGLAERLMEHRRAVRDAEERRITDSQAKADERDSHPGVAGGLVTPSEAGFEANSLTDLSQGDRAEDEGDEDEEGDDEGDEADEPTEDAPPADGDAATQETEAPRPRKRARRPRTDQAPAAKAEEQGDK